MKELLSTLKLGIMLIALPMVATAAAAGYQLADEDWSSVKLPESVSTINVANSGIESHRRHTARLDANGNLMGRVVSLANNDRIANGLGQLDVTIAIHRKVIAKSTTSSDGSFSIPGLQAGVYSFMARGDAGMAVFGINVLAASEDGLALELEVAAVTTNPGTTYSTITQPAIEFMGDDNVDLDILGGSQIMLTNGVLRGKVYTTHRDQGVSDTLVSVAKDGVEMGSTYVDENGEFELPNLVDGVYDFAASGPNGFAAVGFEAVNAEATTHVISETKEVLTSTATHESVAQDVFAPTPIFEIVLMPIVVDEENDEDIVFIDDTITDGGTFGANNGGFIESPYFGGGGGGGFGGGGFGGGGDGFGRLFGAAALATGIVALSDNQRTIRDSSPIIP